MKVEKVIDVNTRWEQDIPHDPRSIEIMKFLQEYDYKFCDLQFDWRYGGDGNNGEELMYQLDEYFACKDKEGQGE